MARQVLQSSASPGQNVSAGGVRAFTPLDTTEVNPVVGLSIDQVRKEVDDAYTEAQDFYNQEPDDVMRRCSGHSARLSYIRARITRIEDYRREWKDCRTRDVEPAIEEIWKQYQIASRLHSARELDWKIESGER